MKKRYRKKKSMCPSFVKGIVISITSPERIWRKMTVL
jgi:hypothetical protein